MRLLELYLKAYGPFTERRLGFSRKAGGLHILFGRNEAGKSSALRALRDLLFGIELRSADNFVHSYSQMRIGGQLELSDGRQLHFLRKKGSKNTLRSYDDAHTLPDTELEPFLSGTSRMSFERFFGINHRELIEGGQSLQAFAGEVGTSLFAASMGGTQLRRVLTELEASASDLFKPTGTKPSINAAVARFKELQRQVRDHSLKGRDWEALDREAARRDKELATLDDDLRRERAQHTRLVRLSGSLVQLARRRVLLEELAASAPVRPLEEDFGERLDAALAKRSKALEAQDDGLLARDKLDTQLAGLKLDPALLDQRVAIDALREELGHYRKACGDLPSARGETKRLAVEVDTRLTALRPDLRSCDDKLSPQVLAALRAPLARREEIQELANAHGAIANRAETARKTLRAEERRLETTAAALEALRPAWDDTELRAALHAAHRIGDVDAQQQKLAASLELLEATSSAQLQALGLWSGSLGELEVLAVPSMETIERFQGDFDAAQRATELNTTRRQHIAAEQRDVSAQLAQLQHGGDLPSEEDLRGARSARDRIWQTVKRSWLLGEAAPADDHEPSSDSPLQDRYERSVDTADQLADRLRREAERVAAQAELLAKRAQLERDAAAENEAKSTLEQRMLELDESWTAIWQACGIRPLPPREMLGWRRRQQELSQAATRQREARDELRRLDSLRAERRGQMLAALSRADSVVELSGDALAPVVLEAEAAAKGASELSGQHNELEREREGTEARLRDAKDELESAQARLQDWRSHWAIASDGLGVSPHAPPAQALDALGSLSEITERIDSLGALELRIESLERDVSGYESTVRDFARSHRPGGATMPTVQIVAELGQRLSETEAQEVQRLELERQRREQSEILERAERDRENANATLGALQREADCDDEAALAARWTRWQHHQLKRQALEEIEDSLREAAGDRALSKLEEEARDLDRDSLPGQIAASEEDIARLDAARQDCLEARAQVRSALKAMNGAAEAAAAAEQAQEVLASLQHDVEEYIRLRLAHSTLRKEIERYREAHQGSFLERASELLRRMTAGEFSGLQSHYDEDDVQEFIGVRRHGQTVRVDAMSSGTRDQLFLALRLAALEDYLERSEAFPFIVDDILVNFDDERALATLELLAELGQRTQVLLFTHHSRIREHATQIAATHPGVELLELANSAAP